MKLSEIKTALNYLSRVEFVLPDGQSVPEHFHVTEVGVIHKNFIDCGGTIRAERVINFQLFTATDYDHRLSAEKLKSIIELSEQKLSLEDADLEIEFQGRTIEKYGLAFINGRFQLVPKQTDCLAKDACGIPATKTTLNSLSVTTKSCTPGSGCC